MSVTSFTYADTEIIVIIQRLVGTDNIQSEVYEFKNDSARKIHVLKTVNPKLSITYRLKDVNYLVIFDECDSVLYEWTGKTRVVLFYLINNYFVICRARI